MRKNWIGCKIHMILIRQFFFSRLPSLTLAPMQVSVGAFLFKKIFSLFSFLLMSECETLMSEYRKYC